MVEAASNPLPRWRGFNLLEKYKLKPSSRRIWFGSDNPPYRRSDFYWIADWGFDFVRLPMSYHFWSRPERWMKVDERSLAHVDAAVELGRECGIHVCLNLHRAPGYCVNHPPEPRSLWCDSDALEACCHHWRILAKRYSGISSAHLSFDLLNEPPPPSDVMTRVAHERVIRALTAAIRDVDPDRLIIADGLSWGNDPLPELVDLGIAQSCRAYQPIEISHYKSPWVSVESFEPPRWPCVDRKGEVWDRARLQAHYDNWAQLMGQGVGIHCGEAGSFCETPHVVFMDWLRDVLEILQGLGIGFALWNFRGPFGLLDSGRKDITYADWHGHLLDRSLLKLLQEH